MAVGVWSFMVHNIQLLMIDVLKNSIICFMNDQLHKSDKNFDISSNISLVFFLNRFIIVQTGTGCF
jgi:hypothetical protein